MSKSQIIKNNKRHKRSGAFYRRAKKCFGLVWFGLNQNILATEDRETIDLPVKEEDWSEQNVFSSIADERISSTENDAFINEVQKRDIKEEINNWEIELDELREDEDHSEDIVNAEKNTKLVRNIRTWAVSFNVLHVALRALFKNII